LNFEEIDQFTCLLWTKAEKSGSNPAIDAERKANVRFSIHVDNKLTNLVELSNIEKRLVE
jgi:hypothetical protein